jgi:hypothetical protein
MKKSKQPRRLVLSVAKVRELRAEQLGEVAGGSDLALKFAPWIVRYTDSCKCQ